MNHALFHGSHREIGAYFGAVLAEQGFFLLENVPFPITSARRQFARACLPLYQAHFPEILAEIQGAAQSQRCAAADLQAVLFSMYALPPSCACSCFAVLNQGQALMGRNSDFLAALESQALNALYRFSGDSFDFMGNTTSFLQMEDGVNQWGLAAGLTSVAPVDVRPGLNGGMLVRFVLEKCRDTRQALFALRQLPIASAQTILLADRQGQIALVECSAQGMETIRPTALRPYLWATNAFHSAKMASFQGPQEELWQSERRFQTLERALAGRTTEPDLRFAQNLLAGQYGFLCQYDPASGCDTLWSALYDLGGKTLWRAEGNPSRRRFEQDARFSIA